MTKEFIPYEQALALKELGFDEPCFCYWYTKQGSFPSIRGKDIQFNGWKNYPDSNTIAPLYQQAFRWFREKYKLRINIMDFINESNNVDWDYEIAIIGTDVDEKGNYNPLVDYSTDDISREFKTYEEAELACLKKLIEIVKTS